MPTLAEQWRNAFLTTVQQRETAQPLKQAACREALSDWTTHLTTAVVATCESLSWEASAKGNPIQRIPVKTNEFLSLDVTAFEPSDHPWAFPIAIMELENQDSRVPYSLWKVLCVRAQLRVVFGYSRTTDERASLINALKTTVLFDQKVEQLMGINGETLVVIGSRDEAEQFPYGYFKWWRLEPSTRSFSIV